MRSICVSVVILCVVVAGCTASERVGVVGGGKEDPRIVKALLDEASEKGLGDAALAGEDLRLEPMTPEGAVGKTEVREPKLSAQEMLILQLLEEERARKAGDDVPAEAGSGIETQPEASATEMTNESSDQKVAEKPMEDMEFVKLVPKATEGGASVELVPEEKKPKPEEPVLDSRNPEATATVAVEHWQVRSRKILRCMACDDVSNLNQCVSCGHHHAKLVTCSEEHLEARCEACYGKKGETVVVYPADAPCGACGQSHASGPHCPPCANDTDENK